MCQNVGLCGFDGIMRLGINPTTPLTNSYCAVLKQQYFPPNMPQVLLCLSLIKFRFFYVAITFPQYILNHIFHNILIMSKSIIEYTHKDKKGFQLPVLLHLNIKDQGLLTTEFSTGDRHCGELNTDEIQRGLAALRCIYTAYCNKRKSYCGSK